MELTMCTSKKSDEIVDYGFSLSVSQSSTYVSVGKYGRTLAKEWSAPFHHVGQTVWQEDAGLDMQGCLAHSQNLLSESFRCNNSSHLIIFGLPELRSIT